MVPCGLIIPSKVYSHCLLNHLLIICILLMLDYLSHRQVKRCNVYRLIHDYNHSQVVSCLRPLQSIQGQISLGSQISLEQQLLDITLPIIFFSPAQRIHRLAYWRKELGLILAVLVSAGTATVAISVSYKACYQGGQRLHNTQGAHKINAHQLKSITMRVLDTWSHRV